MSIATGSGGLGSVANYVSVFPPSDSTDVEKIIVMANINPIRTPRCFPDVRGGEVVNCIVSLSNGRLRIVVKFNGRANEQRVHVYEARTIAMATYVEKDALCRDEKME
jgi:hypothetical protein